MTTTHEDPGEMGLCPIVEGGAYCCMCRKCVDHCQCKTAVTPTDHTCVMDVIPRGDLIFCAAGGREILRMKPDGTIQFSSMTQAEAAREFLDLLAQLWPHYVRNPVLCEHPEEFIEFFRGTHEAEFEHAEWCSVCGAYRVASGDNGTWGLPQSIKRMLGQL